MTVTSTIVGIMLSIPFGIGAARNIAPAPVYAFCRAFIAVARSLQEVIIAIFLVVLFGFGPFAGFLTLAFATIGFLAKLLAEDIEDCDPAPLEAIRATGADGRIDPPRVCPMDPGPACGLGVSACTRRLGGRAR